MTPTPLKRVVALVAVAVFAGVVIVHTSSFAVLRTVASVDLVGPVALLGLAAAAWRCPSAALRPLLGAVVGGAIALLWACANALRTPFPHGPHGHLERAQGIAFNGVVSAVLLGLLGAGLGFALRRVAVGRAARGVAWATAAALVALLGAASVTASRAPAPGSYLASTTLYARLPARTHRAPGVDRGGDPCRDVIPFGPVALVRDCDGACGVHMTRCALSLTHNPRGGPTPASLDAAPRSPAVLSADRTLRVRLDEGRDLMFVDDGDALVALDLRALRPVPVSPRTLAPALAPPRAWIALGAMGLGLAIALLAASRRRGATPRAATLRADGALVLDGRALAGVAVAPEVSPGPVVVFLADALPPQHYRDDAPLRGVRVEPGTLDDHRARLTERARAGGATAFVIAALAGVPLAAWAGTSVVAHMASREKAPAPATHRSVEGVDVEVIAFGRGAPLTDGHTVDLHYTGTLLDGTEFDSSRSRAQPFTFRYGGGQVIPGFERGMRGMRVGERRRVVIPPALGYGERRVSGRIPPNATLVFDIELLAVR